MFSLGASESASDERYLLAMQKQIDNLGTRFYNDDIVRAELLDGLWLFIPTKKETC